MSHTVLEKMRKINKILQRQANRPINFYELSSVLSKILYANIYVVGTNGHVLGFGLTEGYNCNVVVEEILEGKKLPEKLNQELLDVQETKVNVINNEHDCIIDSDIRCPYSERYNVFIPINGGGERLGTLILSRSHDEFNDEDVVLGEHSATVVALEILYSVSHKKEEEAREKAVVQMAIGTLSYSELEAMEHIFRELNGKEGLLVASKIADRVGITRSVIVNALRKFESAGVIESRSLGMKGTYIKVLNNKLIDELKKFRT